MQQGLVSQFHIFSELTGIFSGVVCVRFWLGVCVCVCVSWGGGGGGGKRG